MLTLKKIKISRRVANVGHFSLAAGQKKEGFSNSVQQLLQQQQLSLLRGAAAAGGAGPDILKRLY